jgi:hypothetical protein
MKMNVFGNDKMQTPRWLFNELNARFNFTLDAACDSGNALCHGRYAIDEGIDGKGYSATLRSRIKARGWPKRITQYSGRAAPLQLWCCPRTAWTLYRGTIMSMASTTTTC